MCIEVFLSVVSNFVACRVWRYARLLCGPSGFISRQVTKLAQPSTSDGDTDFRWIGSVTHFFVRYVMGIRNS